MAGRGPRKRKVDGNGIPLPVSATGVSTIPKPKHVAADRVASECFDSVVALLAARGDLRPAYALAIGLLASEHARYVVAATLARKEPLVGGTRGLRANPAAAIAAAAGRTVMSLLQELGFTAAAMSRIDVPTRPTSSTTGSASKTTVAADDPDVDDWQRFQLTTGTEAEKAAVVADVLDNRRMFA